MAAVKALQQWCRLQCEGYRDVSVTNMTTSFRDGLAFCALIHRHRPDLINFDSLKKDDVYENNKLAFSVAEQQLGIPALLDAEDMVALRVPDRLSILTYVSQYYNYFHGRSPIGGMAGVKRPAEGTTEQQPAGKKNAPVSAKVFPSSGPTKENLPPTDHSRPPLSAQDIPAQRPRQTGTLSNKCVSCNMHVHLVQRHLVDGKLYHRNCAKTLTGNPFSADLPKNSSLSLAPDPEKTNPRVPSWLTHKSSAPSSVSSSTLQPQPPVHSSNLPTSSPMSPSPRTSAPSKKTFTSTSTPSATSTTPTPAPRSSNASKNLQAKMKFFQANGGEEKKSTEMFWGQREEHQGTHSVTLVVPAGGKEREREREKEKEREREKERQEREREKERAREEREREKERAREEREREKERAREEREREKERAREERQKEKKRVKEEREKEESQAKASAAAFISKKLTEENNNKPGWAVKPSPTEAPKDGVQGRVKLRANPSLLSDLSFPSPEDRHSPSPKSTTKDKLSPGAPKPRSTSPQPSGSASEAPSDWRARLKPVSKEPSPKPSSQPQPKPWTNGSDLSHPSGPTRPAPTSPAPRSSITAPTQKGLSAPSRDSAAEKEPSNKTKNKADYIPQEEILKELQQIEDSLNDLEKTGVELELKLRTSEENGEDESVMNELMVEWFTLIRNKQVAMRRESELVYIGRTQELEEEQPTVEQELRRLLDKPDHLKTAWDRCREETLLKKLVEIVDNRNAIVEGLDEDRLREEEEDEQLNQLMMNFNLKKDSTKKKSPLSRLFSRGSKDS